MWIKHCVRDEFNQNTTCTVLYSNFNQCTTIFCLRLLNCKYYVILIEVGVEMCTVYRTYTQHNWILFLRFLNLIVNRSTIKLKDETHHYDNIISYGRGSSGDFFRFLFYLFEKLFSSDEFEPSVRLLKLNSLNTFILTIRHVSDIVTFHFDCRLVCSNIKNYNKTYISYFTCTSDKGSNCVSGVLLCLKCILVLKYWCMDNM